MECRDMTSATGPVASATRGAGSHLCLSGVPVTVADRCRGDEGRTRVRCVARGQPDCHTAIAGPEGQARPTVRRRTVVVFGHCSPCAAYAAVNEAASSTSACRSSSTPATSDARQPTPRLWSAVHMRRTRSGVGSAPLAPARPEPPSAGCSPYPATFKPGRARCRCRFVGPPAAGGERFDNVAHDRPSCW